MDDYRRGGSFWAQIPPVTKNLIIINLILWVATLLFKGRVDLNDYLGLHFWQANDFNLAQLVTYMFMHDTSSVPNGLLHIGFNMFNLWMFGRLLEQVLGAKRFLTYYMVCGLGAAFVQEAMWQLTWANTPMLINSMGTTFSINDIQGTVGADELGGYIDMVQSGMVTIGASGAVFGLLLAFGMMFPNMEMFIIPFPKSIKAKWMVLGYGALELVFGVTGSMSGVAHYAHLGGMLFGLLLILWWKHKGQWGNRSRWL